GKPQESLLVKAIHYKDELRMPPKGQLSKGDIAALTTWIKVGAPWPQAVAEIRTVPKSGFKITPQDRAFWSFQPITDPPVPRVRDAAWPKSSIDYFILARLEAEKLRPSGAADKRSLLRR